jgi:transcriptional regulator with XRE-family HTH domain
MNKIAEVAKSQGRKIPWLANQVGIKVKTFQNYCSNTNQPSISTLKKVADVLDVKMEELVA